MLNPFSSAEHRVRPRWNGSLSFAQGQLGSAWRARRDRKRVNSIHDVCIAQQSLASIFSRCAKASPLNSPDSIEPPDHDCGNEHDEEVSGEGARTIAASRQLRPDCLSSRRSKPAGLRHAVFYMWTPIKKVPRALSIMQLRPCCRSLSFGAFLTPSRTQRIRQSA